MAKTNAAKTLKVWVKRLSLDVLSILPKAVDPTSWLAMPLHHYSDDQNNCNGQMS
jgi:hypothetical protein